MRREPGEPSLLELLAVIVIVGILLCIAVPLFLHFQAAANR